MNADQIERIQSSFNALAPQADELVNRFYTKLFSDHPEVRPMFPDDMAEQKKKLAGSIGLVVKNVARFEQIAPALREMGARHVEYGTQPEHYPVVRDTLLSVMSEMAGSLWNDDLQADWTAALNAVAATMIEGAEQLQRKAA